MSVPVFKTSLVIAVVAVAVIAGAWYFLAPPDATPVALSGRIEGITGYPSEFNPEQTVCAQSVTDAALVRCVDAPEQEGSVAPTFSIKVPAGRYTVYAILKDPADLGLTEQKKAYWSAFVTCGFLASCADHSPLEVIVSSGATVTGIQPHDWYTN
ncbi:MAG: hypothetical protein IT405_01925 [Candidatus Yanofskybacteria bacterium]|nr:hypothetical protein [Candidatus Yanofskybacteria bacterium]